MLSEKSQRTQNWYHVCWPRLTANASRRLSASAELLVFTKSSTVAVAILAVELFSSASPPPQVVFAHYLPGWTGRPGRWIIATSPSWPAAVSGLAAASYYWFIGAVGDDTNCVAEACPIETGRRLRTAGARAGTAWSAGDCDVISHRRRWRWVSEVRTMHSRHPIRRRAVARSPEHISNISRAVPSVSRLRM